MGLVWRRAQRHGHAVGECRGGSFSSESTTATVAARGSGDGNFEKGQRRGTREVGQCRGLGSRGREGEGAVEILPCGWGKGGRGLFFSGSQVIWEVEPS